MSGPFDVVTLALKPTCVNRRMVQSLVEHLVPKPRTIHVIAVQCTGFERFHPSVRCHADDKLVPGLTASSVGRWLEERLGAVRWEALDRAMALRRSSWYFQQLVKLAAAEHIQPPLTEHFLIWDSDMIMLRPMTWFVPPETPSGSATGAHTPAAAPAVHLPAGPVPQPSGVDSSQGCVNPLPFRTVIHVGGWHSDGYRRTYQSLTGHAPRFGPAQSSFVAHHMLVHRPFLSAFLRDITAPQHRNDTRLGWAHSILDAAASLQDVQQYMVGFSEYWSYLSWVLEHHPCAVALTARQEWDRVTVPTQLPVGVRHQDGASTQFLGVCCPTADSLRVFADRGVLFAGYEIGHRAYCNYAHPAFKDGYAQWFMDV
ncbi:hypothetical protein HYH03_001667 [Edaphochlamys debaryana]|uniref:Uncharacterized protein n=1 Tax=Edaphochlamys debaryana TaxID=47281 RepID=A0A836C698_9CHLO|nr:hypothetical protein HYH03_001667 [Edaphochlamys debaryana]|eukprot:KAG2500908.1 hypothetical protein HYH03_001667 [Edaphochlamys debaryana]